MADGAVAGVVAGEERSMVEPVIAGALGWLAKEIVSQGIRRLLDRAFDSSGPAASQQPVLRSQAGAWGSRLTPAPIRRFDLSGGAVVTSHADITVRFADAAGQRLPVVLAFQEYGGEGAGQPLGAWYQGLRVMALDGVVLDVPATPDNDVEFGRVGNNDSPNTFPQVRLLALAECGTHAIVGAAFGPINTTQERDLIPDLLPCLDSDMLVVADRGFYSYQAWTAAREQGAQLLWRVKTTLTLPVLAVLPDGSYRSNLLPREVRREANRGRLRVVPEGIPVRVIEYMVEDRGEDTETYCLITSILDHELAPAAELAALYHERWEIELVFDEIETHQIGSPCRLRSRTPKLVKQEIWALLLTHYAIRHLMTEAADAIALDPDRLSFLRSLRLVRRQVTDQAAFSP